MDKTDHELELEIDNLPNRLTFFRMLMIPVVVLAIFQRIQPYGSCLTRSGWVISLVGSLWSPPLPIF